MEHCDKKNDRRAKSSLEQNLLDHLKTKKRPKFQHWVRAREEQDRIMTVAIRAVVKDEADL